MGDLQVMLFSYFYKFAYSASFNVVLAIVKEKKKVRNIMLL
jgi:hypothetical protein